MQLKFDQCQSRGRGEWMSHSELQYTPCLFGKTKRIFILLETKDFSVSTDFISASLSVLEKEIVWVLP